MNAVDPFGRFLTLAQVIESTGLSRSQVYRAMYWRDNPFPRPVKIRTRSYWVEAEVAEWKRRVVESQETEGEDDA